jgi:hypothetical protein
MNAAVSLTRTAHREERVNLEGIKRIITLQRDNARLKNQVTRLRRLLEESESRWGTNIGPAFRLGVRRKRNLPSIRRDQDPGF